MVIISDGNIAENQTNKGIPLSLGYDKDKQLLFQ